MTETLSLLSLTGPQAALLAAICCAAGIVRGFSGFALSAIVMASAVLILPPVELIPMLWWLELTASLMMLKGGWRDADRGTVAGLAIGSALGMPIGLWLTITLTVETSKLIALVIIITLAASQLAKLRLNAFGSRPGLAVAGMTAGIVSGLANVGGLVVALFVLSRDATADRMRATMVLFLFIGALSSMITMLIYHVMDMQAVTRGLVFTLPTALGVVAGQALFSERYQRYYKPVCLSLLITLASFGTLRLVAH